MRKKRVFILSAIFLCTALVVVFVFSGNKCPLYCLNILPTENISVYKSGGKSNYYYAYRGGAYKITKEESQEIISLLKAIKVGEKQKLSPIERRCLELQVKPVYCVKTITGEYNIAFFAETEGDYIFINGDFYLPNIESAEKIKRLTFLASYYRITYRNKESTQ